MGEALRRRKWLIPWLLMLPGLIWLVAFFVVPNIRMLQMALSTGTLLTGFESPPDVWVFSNFPDNISKYSSNLVNSIVYGGLATTLCFLIGYPLAYGIAFRGGRYKNLLLFLVIAPFFTSFLIRTISWKIILGNDGPFLAIVRDTLGLVPANFTIIGTPLAVVAGLTYEFLPFMVLPLYVALERVDRRLIEAAQDLYAGPWRPAGSILGTIVGAGVAMAAGIGLGYARFLGDGADPVVVAFWGIIGGFLGFIIGTAMLSQSFVRVTFPLTLPGVFAGSLLVLIPALGDYVNASLLGSPRTQMMGNVIQGRFLNQSDYPTAASLAFVLMAAILIGIFIYARLLGTEELEQASAL